MMQPLHGKEANYNQINSGTHLVSVWKYFLKYWMEYIKKMQQGATTKKGAKRHYKQL
jgi:hypothetical protein